MYLEATNNLILLLILSHSIVSNFLRLHGLQHTRLPWPSPSPKACSTSCPWCWWCHPTILVSVIPFSSCLQSFPASGSFPVSPFFTLGGQNIGASASASVLQVNTQNWFPLDWLVWSPFCPRDSQGSSPIPYFKSINSLTFSLWYDTSLTSIHDYWKIHCCDYMDIYLQSNVSAF